MRDMSFLNINTVTIRNTAKLFQNMLYLVKSNFVKSKEPVLDCKISLGRNRDRTTYKLLLIMIAYT